MRNKAFSIILEDCLQRLDRGESLPELLADFPELSEELKPLLLVAMASRAFPVPIPSQRAQRLGRNQMLAEMNRLEIKKAFRAKATIPTASHWIGRMANLARRGGLNRLATSYRLAMVSLVIMLSGGYFTISASASSQPGDLLYNLKLGLQRVGLTISIPHGSAQGEDPLPILPEPKEFGRYIWTLDGIYKGIQDTGSGPSEPTNDYTDFLTDDIENERDILRAEKEAEKEIKKDLKEAVKEATKNEKDAEKDLKEEEKEAAKDEKDTEKDLKEED